MKVNYIKHLENIHSTFVEDSRITPFHFSLYMALFHQWNSAMFPEQLSIARSEIMRFSKLGSVNTYTKCLKELHAFGYIEYVPSKNPYVGSSVNMYRFDNSSSNSCDTSMCLKTDNSSDNTSETVVRPYINSINNNKQLKTINNRDDLKIVSTPKSKREIFISPSLKEAILFFKEKNKTDLDAEKFFNHFESNGWLVGGKSKMKNWQAAARNWMLNSEKFQFQKKQPTPGNLNVNQNKDYSVPL
ncbi:MAG: transcriptional regulator [Crocinitomicaceae bacterium]|nr:transcriptional regulator [Crocinitomicaceae bacterium]MCF8444697.1 transcriptional regulator [Crocinitomicaceae bacterium]